MMHAFRLGAIASLFAIVGSRHAAAQEEPSRPPEPVAAARLPLVTGIARVRVEVTPKHVVVIHDVNLARGAYAGEPLEAYVAFGAPGAPRAFDARLVAVPEGALEAPPAERGVALPWSYAPRRPASAWPLVGPATMAGVVVQIAPEILARALERGGMATLRIRAIHALPEADANREREVLVRLGEVRGSPLVLGRVELASSEPGVVDHASARLCRAGALGQRLAMRTLLPRGPSGRPTSAPDNDGATPVAPVLAARAPGQDLCVRFSTGSLQKSGSATAAPES
jgi:hypothetical protein